MAERPAPNPYEAPQAADEQAKPYKSWVHLPTPRDSWLGVLRQGVWIGWKWTTIVVGPVILSGFAFTLYVSYRYHVLQNSRPINSIFNVSLAEEIGVFFTAYVMCCVIGIVAAVFFCIVVDCIRRD